MTVRHPRWIRPAAAPWVDVPGGVDYRTLEIEWLEQGVEQRLFLNLAADETHWWVSEIRTYDGSPEGEWITYTGPFFKSPLGESFRGGVHLTSSNGRLDGVLERWTDLDASLRTGVRGSCCSPGRQ